MHQKKNRLFAICVTLMVLASPAFSQDMGIADTVRISDAIGDIDHSVSIPFSVPVSVFNDYDLKSIIIPLIIDGYSGWLRFDSIAYTGGRLDDPNVLDIRETYSFGTDSITVDSLVLKFELGSGVVLPAGDGKICDLWLRPIYGGEISLDSLTVSPYGNLRLVTTADDQFTPQFQAGTVTVDCDYMIGDVRCGGGVTLDDVMGIHKYYIGCFDFGWGNPWHADVNCDRLIDLRDVVNLTDYVFNDSSDILCECGTYSPAYYNDPGVPDTIWIESDILYVGREDTLDVGIINNEMIRAFAIGMEWDGTAVLRLEDAASAERISDLYPFVYSYMCFNDYRDLVNPDTTYLATWLLNMDTTSILPGTEEVFHLIFTPLSEGVIDFNLVSFPISYSQSLTRGGESMLVTRDKAAILPVLAGGNIVVLPYLCGDVNSDKAVNVSDAVGIINYVFVGGNPPDPIESGDTNCDGECNVSDAVWIINFVFVGGNDPCDTDGDSQPDC